MDVHEASGQALRMAVKVAGWLALVPAALPVDRAITGYDHWNFDEFTGFRIHL